MRRSKLGKIRLVLTEIKIKINRQQLTEIKIKSNHQTDLAGTLSGFERSVAILASTLRPPQEIRRRTWRGNLLQLRILTSTALDLEDYNIRHLATVNGQGQIEVENNS